MVETVATNFLFRKQAVKQLTTKIGVYILCDLDGIPIYVGQSKESIRGRVARHLTSARSDIIANRQIDVWEIAWVWAYPVSKKSEIADLEAALFHRYNPKSQLMNGTRPAVPSNKITISEPAQKIQVMSDDEIKEKKDPVLRLPRQAAHYAHIVGHFLAVKDSTQVARAMDAHFERLSKYHKMLLNIASPEQDEEEE